MRIFRFVIVFGFTALSLFLYAESANNRIAWNPSTVTQQVLIGTSTSMQISFTSTTELSNIRVQVVPEIAPFVSASQTTLAAIPSGISQSLVLIFSVPKGTAPQTLSGTIRLVGVNNGTIAQPLPVTIQIQQASINNLPSDIALSSPDRIASDPNLTVGNFIKDEVDIFFKAGVQRIAIDALVSQISGTYLGSIPELNFYQVQVPQEGLQNLSNLVDQINQNPDVDLAKLAYLVPPQGLPNDPGVASVDSQTILNMMNLPAAWDITTGSNAFDIAVVDNFFDNFHRDLKDNIAYITPRNLPFYTDHGTRVASIIGAKGDNGIGIAGTMWNTRLRLYSAGVVGAPFLDDRAIEKYLTDIVLGQNPPRIINYSGGVGCENCTSQDLIALAKTDASFGKIIRLAKEQTPPKDILWVFASADKFTNVNFTSPARLSGLFLNVISVSSVNNQKKLARSNYGAAITIAAPGVGIYSDVPGGLYDNQATGTSFAAPYVTGVAGLMRSVNPNLMAEDLKRIIHNAAQPTGNFDPDHNEILLLDALKAVQQASAPTNCDSFLSFIEGNPCIPGDGTFIDASSGTTPFGFELNAPYSLSGVTDGLTITVFLPPNAQNIQNLNVRFIVPNRTGPFGPCAIVAGLNLPARTVTFNGVQGLLTNISQSDLEEFTSILNSLCPPITLNDLVLTEITIGRVSAPPVTSLDAAIIRRGQNVFP